MSEETRKILDMLHNGKISVDEAESLLDALAPGGSPAGEPAGTAANRKYIRIQVDPAPGAQNTDRVNVRVPMKLIRAGLKLAAFLPADAQSQVTNALREKGINADLTKLTPADIEELMANLDELTVDVEGKQNVRIYTE